jgi:hypothetical protein
MDEGSVAKGLKVGKKLKVEREPNVKQGLR